MPEPGLPPTTFHALMALLEGRGLDVQGWYAESAEGILSAYQEDPDETVRLVDEVDRLATAA